MPRRILYQASATETERLGAAFIAKLAQKIPEDRLAILSDGHTTWAQICEEAGFTEKDVRRGLYAWEIMQSGKLKQPSRGPVSRVILWSDGTLELRFSRGTR